jgi:hypothetical protein
VSVKLLDKTGATVAVSEGAVGLLNVKNAKLWWPFTMVENDADAGYLYTLVVQVYRISNEFQIAHFIILVYRQSSETQRVRRSIFTDSRLVFAL